MAPGSSLHGSVAKLFLIGLCLFPSLHLAAADPERAVEAAGIVNTFAAAHHQLQPAGNVLTSPWSIQTNLALVYAGAGGQTREAMRNAFFFPADDRLHAAFLSLRQSILEKPAADVAMDVRVANRVFTDQSLTLLPGWTGIARSSYSAEPGALDFSRDPAGAGRTINQWVSEQTNGKIPEIIPNGLLDAQTRLVLVNAAYFDLPWDERFTKELTRDQPFYVDATHAKTVPLMFKQHRLGYARKAGFQIAALPYAGGAFQFVVILPDADVSLTQVEKAITGKLLWECTRLAPTEVRLSIPRLRIEPPIVNLQQSLTAMGAGAMFQQSADFSRMSKEPLYVSRVFHRTYLELDEDGTKAASATAAVIRPKNGAPREIPHLVVKADHPFLYMIQHVPSGACLFLGRLTDPAPGKDAVNATRPASEPPVSKK